MADIAQITLPDGSIYNIKDSTTRTKLSGIQDGAQVNVQSDWNETNSAADSFIVNKPSIVDLKRGIKIEDNTDLDDIMDLGNYYCENAASAATLSNCPTSYGFILKVFESASGIQESTGIGFKIQILIPQATSLSIYLRYYRATNETWYSWSKLIDEQVRNTRFTLNSAGSQTISIDYGLSAQTVAMYQITCCKYNDNNNTNTGSYLVKVYKNGSTIRSNVHAIKSATGVTITTDGTNLTITTSGVTYMAFSVNQVF